MPLSRRTSTASALAAAVLVLGPSAAAARAEAPVAEVPVVPVAPQQPAPVPVDGGVRLTLLHANDLESALLPEADETGAEHAGAARFAALVERQRAAAEAGGPVLTLAGGDLFLPGPQLDASRLDGTGELYDALAFDAAGFDASAIGNHDFDLTPDFLADYLDAVSGEVPFVAANLDLSGEPRLQAQADDGTVVTSTVVESAGERFGVIGLTTPELPELTSLGEVRVDPDLAGVANAQAAALEAAGVTKVVLVSHLQDVDNEVAHVPQLRGVDFVVAAGGGEVMASPGDALLPGDAVSTDAAGAPLAYPVVAAAADGARVPVVTTSGLYRYVGQLVVDFDAEGRLVAVDDAASRPLPVTSTGPDAVAPDPDVVAEVEEPVAAYVDGLASQVVASTEVPLDGRRDAVRSRETGLGSLVADSLLAAGRAGAEEAGVAPPVVALQNGGGIRNDSVLPVGGVSALDTYDVTPFANFVAVAPELPVEAFVAAVDHGAGAGAGSFAQVAGFSYTADPDAPAGARVQALTLADGTPVVVGGQRVLDGTISVASIDFLLRGSDGYDALDGAAFEVLPTTQQQALQTYLADDLGGTVTAAQYPEAGTGRIAQV